MSRISCDVTRDLLAVYLDDVCSEESRELVDEHLQECQDCRDFLEKMRVTDIKESSKNEQFQFFKKAKQYIDNRNKLVFAIALLFTILVVLIAIYSELYYSHIPEMITYVSVPVLMCTFFLAQPVKQNKDKRYLWLQIASLALDVFLIGFHMFSVDQLTILLTSPNDERLCALFRTEAYYLGPFLEKVYMICVLIEIILLITYYVLGQKKKHSFMLGQNASWLGIGLGLAFRASLYQMETLESFKQMSIDMICVLLAEFVVVFIINMLYVKKKTREW